MKRQISARRVCFGLWIGLVPFLVLLCSWPVNSSRVREAIVLTLAALIAGSLVFAWRSRWVFGALLLGYALIAIFLLLPGWPVGGEALRNAYTAKVKSFEGVPYVWGGEGRWGMDCSGLVRRAMEEALLEVGLKTANPRALRESALLWWDDTTAKEMGRGYAGRMEAVTICQSLNETTEPPLQPGDLAVTTSGIHVMVYAGDHVWVGADPSEGKVTLFKTPGEKNGYFSSPMNIMRWGWLEK